MNIYIEIKNLIINLVKEKYKSLDPKVFISINCEQPKNLSFGDVSSNVLMVVSKKLGLKSEELKKEWNQYRCDAISKLVQDLKKIVHSEKMFLSAAVFPYPKMSSAMVRQDWSSWDLDMICPMNYHHFYDENIEWIGKSVASGIKYLKPESKYLSGIFIGALNQNDLKSTVIECVKNGASGVSIFSANGITNSHLKVIKSFQLN